MELLVESVDLLRDSPRQLEYARALADLGVAISRTGKAVQARPNLMMAMDLARRSGATALEDRTRQELLATGARPRRRALTGSESLTPSERRVAYMAAQGQSNREIAEGLFVTLRTVEIHLTHAYDKLGIRSRSQLATALPGAAAERLQDTRDR